MSDNKKLSRTLYYICLLIIAVIFIIIIIFKLLNIDTSYILDGQSRCFLLEYAGLYCPGCGGTRAVIYLLHGHILKSIYYHPIVVYTAAVMICFVASHTINIITRGKTWAMQFSPWYGYMAIAIIVVQCIVKNILFVGFDCYILLIRTFLLKC